VNLQPRLLRRFPQLAALDCLHQVTETAIVALCAAHPIIESAGQHEPLSPPDKLADNLVEHLMSMLDAVYRYRALLEDRDRLRRGLQEEPLENLPF
jgi:hypothetical protein